MGDHALLSPSGASRWLACPPSVRLESKYPDTSGDAAAEGTVAHELCELHLKNHLKIVKAIPFKSELKRIKNSQYYTAEMNNHCLDYAAFVLEQFHSVENPVICIEDKVDLRAWAPESFGTSDCYIVGDVPNSGFANQSILYVNDFKYGKGVVVDAYMNKQMMLYSLGILDKVGLLYNITAVVMTIYQPRVKNISTFEISTSELLEWGESVVKPAAKLAFSGKGDFNPGEHCRFCKVRNSCRALANYNMDAAKHAFKEPEELTDIEFSEILKKSSELKQWLTSLENYALVKALKEGKKWPGFKLVAGRSNRVITKEDEVLKILKRRVKQQELFMTEPKLLGIGKLEENIGADVVEKLIGKFILKPAGAPTLVPDWDKRKEINSAESAKDAFSDVPE